MTGSAVRRALRSPLAIDIALAVVVAMVAYGVARRHLQPYYHDAPWIEDLLVPSTGRPGWVPDPVAVKALPQWQAFLAQKVEYFPCSAIAGMPLIEIGISWQRQEYFHRALSSWFRIVGPTINGFITFQSGMFAMTGAIAYLMFRLGMWRVIALACTAGLVWSPLQLRATGLPIEYEKAPWILAAVALCGVVVRRDAQGKSLWAPALASGLAAGFGIGFKTDVMAAVPLALATTLIFVRRNPGGSSRKALATLCVIAGVAIGGGTMIYRNFFGPAGSLFAVQVLGGQDWATEAMHAVSPLYDYGLVFDDSHITVLINSYGHRVLGTTATVYFFSREMQDVSTRLLTDFWTTFPGDLVLRVIAATIRVLQLSGLGVLIPVAGLFLVFARDLRAGWFIAFVAVFLSAYVSLVFQRRHFFHLEFISWWLAGFFTQAILLAGRAMLDTNAFGDAWARFAKPAFRAVLCLSLIGVCAVAALASARAYQQNRMLRLVECYEQMLLDERHVARAAHEPDRVMLRVEGISLRDRRSSGKADEMTSDYLVAKFRCRDGRPISVTATYRPPNAVWDHTFSQPCSASGSTSTLMMPIYQYGAAHVFDGLAMSAQDADTVQSVSTMRQDSSERLWLDLLLPADWRTRDWFERLRIPLETPL